MRSLRQSMSLMICSTSQSTRGSSSALVGGRGCTCVFYCTSLEPFFFFLSPYFMVYSVETVTEAF